MSSNIIISTGAGNSWASVDPITQLPLIPASGNEVAHEYVIYFFMKPEYLQDLSVIISGSLRSRRARDALLTLLPTHLP